MISFKVYYRTVVSMCAIVVIISRLNADTTQKPSDIMQEMERLQEIWLTPAVQENLKSTRDDYIVSKRKTMHDPNLHIKAPVIPDDPNAEFYYRYLDKKIPLEVDIETLLLDFNENLTTQERWAILETLGLKNKRHIGRFEVVSLSTKSRSALETTLDHLRSIPGVAMVQKVFMMSEHPIFIGDKIIVKYVPNISRRQIDNLNETMGTKIVKQLHSRISTMFLLEVVKPLDSVTLDIANSYHENSLVEYAHPDFLASNRLLYTPNDPYFPHDANPIGQDYLNHPNDHDVDAEEAWDITMGSASIKIAIIDEGVEYSHEDLDGNVITGYDVSGEGSPPSPPGSNASGYVHGTLVAGVAAAEADNNIGIAGVAPNCKIMSIRLDSIFSQSAIIAGIDTAVTKGADVINMSFGGPTPTQGVENAVDDAYENGRGGKGCILVAATGNEDEEDVNYPAGYPSVIAVGGTESFNGERYINHWGGGNSGSTYGDHVEIVAPADVLTTDLSGASGLNDGFVFNGNYTTVPGTSFSAPQAAGLAALLFSIDPDMEATTARVLMREGSRDALGLPEEDSLGFDIYHGYGRLSLHNTLLLAKNLIANCNFEYDNHDSYPDSWTNILGSVKAVEGDGNGAGARAGFMSARFDTSGSSYSFAYIGDFYEGQTLTVTTWFKADDAATALVEIADTTGTDTSFVQPTYNTSGPAWQRINLTHEMSVGTQMNPEPVYIIIGKLSSSYVLFDMVTVREGPGGASKPVVFQQPIREPKNRGFRLEQNSPNPFNPATTIAFSVADSEPMDLVIYNALGQKVRTLMAGEPLNAGTHRIVWDGKDERGIFVSSGVYVYELRAGDLVQTRKMLMIK